MTLCRRLAAALGLAAVLLAPGRAAAAPDGSDTNRWRAHLDADLGSWVRQTPWPRRDDGLAGSRDHFGFIGFRRLHLGLGLGHGFRDIIVTGLRLEYEISRGIQRGPVADAETRAITAGAMPYLTLMFNRKNVVRPYVSLRAGIGGGLLTMRDESPTDRPSRSSSMLYPIVGFDLGAHAFVSPDVSLDGMLSIDHRWEYLSDRSPQEVPAGTGDLELNAGRYSFGRRMSTSIVLAVSRWF